MTDDASEGERLQPIRAQVYKDSRPPEHFDRMWSSVTGAVRPGGLLAVDLFGDRDEWAGEAGMTFVDRSRVDRLCTGLDVLELTEVDEDGRAYAGPKHWHRFELIARRPVVA